MNQTNANENGGYGPRPHPYNPQQYGQSAYTGTSYEINRVGKGNIAVISPPGNWHNNTAHSEDMEAARGNQHSGESPPDYPDDGSVDSPFSDAGIRRGFIRKVYLTLMIQLLVTVGIICAFLFWDTLRIWTWRNDWFSYSMMGVVLVLVLVLSCCNDVRRRVPFNFIALGLFTIAEGLMLGSVAAYFYTEAVLWAAGATALMSLSLTLFAVQSKWDFTARSGSLWVFAWTLVSFAMLCAILRSQYLSILYACLATLLFSFYLVCDTQLILGGKHNYAISPEEYVFAALNLYLDIVSLFLLLLNLIALCR